MTTFKKMRAVMGSLAVLAAVALLAGACGSKEAPTKKETAPVKKVEKRPKAPAKPAGPKKSDITPLAMDALQFMPESTTVAMAFPPLNGLIDKCVALAIRATPPSVGVSEEVAALVAHVAGQLGVSGEPKTFGDIASAKGFDLGAPMAFFADLGPTGKQLAEAAAELKAPAPAAVPKAEGASTPTGAETATTTPQEGQATQPPTAVTQPVPAYAEREKIEALFESLDLPAVVGVVRCKDAATAENTLKEFLASGESPFLGVQPKDVKADDVTIHCYDPKRFCYFISGNWLVGGTSLEYVKSVVPRLNTPAEFRYGTVECPPAVADECVQLVYMDKLMPCVAGLFEALAAVDPAMSAMAQTQMQVLDAYQGADPMVTTFSIQEEKIEVLSRLDMKAHPGMKVLTGDATPLRLATLLPEATPFFLSMRFNAETKANIQKSVMGGMPPEVMPPAISNTLPTVLQMVGDELTVGLVGVEGILPKVVLMAGLSNPENTKQFLDALLQSSSSSSETYNGVELKAVTVPAPLPIPLTVAFPQDIVLAGTDVEAMKQIIDLLASQKGSSLFASFNPPIDPAIPRFSALAIKVDAVGAIVKQLLPLMGAAAPPDVPAVIDAVTGLVRDVRASQEFVDGWQRGVFTVYLNPPASV